MFTSRKGGTLAISGDPIIFANGMKKYPVVCSICHEDCELFPSEVYSTLGNLQKGHNPCGCAHIVQWSEFQNKIRIKRACKKRGYEFLGFAEAYRGANTKLILYCKEDSNTWKSTTLSKFVNSGRGCPKCKINKLKSVNKKVDKEVSDTLVSGGNFLNGTTFRRNLEKVNNLGYNVYWDVTCPLCSCDNFVVENLCSGVFTTTLSSLREGSKPCRCSPKYPWTKAQREYQINSVCNLEGIRFCRWVVEEDRPTCDSYFEWLCEKGASLFV
jgi:hypothetical protein